jgi:hypothetical protein
MEVNVDRSGAGEINLSMRLKNAITTIHIGIEHMKMARSCLPWTAKS